ncbi:SGNH/GDSL hydrolase family protein [Streptomyces sp. 7-21]|uniref:SGNH/GDSL hydrolase family protein n=1 Tax=Streptomyces sp. 7-21 TaxID=2802283 RepID=UPI0035A8BA1F
MLTRRCSRRAVLASGAALALATALPASAAAPQAHTAGRVRRNGDTWEYSWPGIYFEGRFQGTGVGVVLDDADNDYDIQVDGATVATLVTPGRVTHWIEDLPDGEHEVRLVKRTESTWAAGRFGGFRAASGGTLLEPPRPRQRQIEFIGDSYTAGYGNISGTRDCSANGGVNRNTNADLSFGALTARRLDADYQLNAFSGRGMVRNYNGTDPGTDFRTYYERALIHVEGDVWDRPASWQPGAVVIGLGINDFSTPLNPGERWATSEELVADYTEAYHGFLDLLRARYGSGTALVVSATHVDGSGRFADAADAIVRERRQAGDDRVHFWYYDDPRLDRMGCDWHPSRADHEIIADLLDGFLATIPIDW